MTIKLGKEFHWHGAAILFCLIAATLSACANVGNIKCLQNSNVCEGSRINELQEAANDGKIPKILAVRDVNGNPLLSGQTDYSKINLSKELRQDYYLLMVNDKKYLQIQVKQGLLYRIEVLSSWVWP